MTFPASHRLWVILCRVKTSTFLCIVSVNDRLAPIRKLRMELPGYLARVINKAAETEPGCRYAGGEAMAGALW